MFLAKLKATVATVVVLAFVGGGIVYSGGGPQQAPKNDLEELRRENQLLKVNLRATLERIDTLEKQLAAAKEPTQALNARRARLAEENARRAEERTAVLRKAQELAIREAEREQVEARKRQRDAAKAAREVEFLKRLLEVENPTVPYPNPATKPADRVNLNKNLNKIADDPQLPESVRRAAREALKMKEPAKSASADGVRKN